MLVTLTAFAISTIGFTFSTHICGGENIRSGILLTNDVCCMDTEIEKPQQVESCCAEKVAETPQPACDGCYTESDCCITDISYVKLSENYLLSENEISSEACNDAPVTLSIHVPEKTDDGKELICKSENIPKPRPPLYRLYNQVKIDPPLI